MLTFDPREWRRWLEFREAVGAEVDPMVVAREWLDARQGTDTAGAGMTVAAAGDRYLELRAGEKLADDTRRHIVKHLRPRFAARYGGLMLAEVMPDPYSRLAGGTGEWPDPGQLPTHCRPLGA
ncbi:MAG: hypothetical protein ACREIA_15025 [Opitutaceae bacterium]